VCVRTCTHIRACLSGEMYLRESCRHLHVCVCVCAYLYCIHVSGEMYCGNHKDSCICMHVLVHIHMACVSGEMYMYLHVGITKTFVCVFTPSFQLELQASLNKRIIS
jgi:hypothetical protein